MKYTAEWHDRVLAAVEKTVALSPVDQYRLYPAVDRDWWRPFLAQRLSLALRSEEACVFFEMVDGLICLLGGRVSRWDEEHFGFGMASLAWFICPGTPASRTVMGRLLGEAASDLRDRGVRFVSAHISGENLMGLHLLEDSGFRYYQTTVYAVARCTDLPYRADPAVRLWREDDVPTVARIATHNQFKQGHFYCDERFERGAVDAMYEKWIRTSWDHREPVAVIEHEGTVAGYFAFVMDEALSQATGLTYGRMTSLALDASIRSSGLGSRLFRSVLALIGERGGQCVASEYPLKNHLSCRLHTKNQFYVAHEKVLLHVWL